VPNSVKNVIVMGAARGGEAWVLEEMHVQHRALAGEFQRTKPGEDDEADPRNATRISGDVHPFEGASITPTRRCRTNDRQQRPIGSTGRRGVARVRNEEVTSGEASTTIRHVDEEDRTHQKWLRRKPPVIGPGRRARRRRDRRCRWPYVVDRVDEDVGEDRQRRRHDERLPADTMSERVAINTGSASRPSRTASCRSRKCLDR